MTLKSLLKTRWCAREDACKSLDADWKAVVSALRTISENEIGKGRCQAEADGLLRKLNSIEVPFMMSVWGFYSSTIMADSIRHKNIASSGYGHFHCY